MDPVSALHLPKKVPLRYVIHVPTFLPTTAWIVGLSAIAATPDFELSSIVTWITVHASTLVLAGLAAIGLREILRLSGKTEVGLLWVIATGALAGLVKALTTPIVEMWLGLGGAPVEALVVRSIGAILVGVWLITIVAYALTAIEKLEEARDSLIRANVAKRLAEDTLVTSPEVEQSVEAITHLRGDLKESPGAVAPERIREVVESTIRPLSHALWSVESKRYPSLKLVSLYRMALGSHKLRSGLIALVWSGTSFTGLAVSAGIVDAAAYTASVGVVAWVLFSLLGLGRTQSVPGSVATVVGASGVAVLGGFGLAGLVSPGTFQTIGIPLLIAGIAWMSFVTLGSSVLSAALNLRSIIDNDLASVDTQELIEEQSGLGAKKLSSRNLATRLHGSIQSKLLGLAAAIEQRGATPEDIDLSLADILEGLERFTTDDTIERPASPAPKLVELTEGWAGILTVDVDDASRQVLDTTFEAEPETAEVVREALTNAYRHGAARRVTIHAIREEKGGVTLLVMDDGYGPRNGPPGLGQALLDRVTGAHWSLKERPEGGAVLEAHLAV